MESAVISTEVEKSRVQGSAKEISPLRSKAPSSRDDKCSLLFRLSSVNGTRCHFDRSGEISLGLATWSWRFLHGALRAPVGMTCALLVRKRLPVAKITGFGRGRRRPSLGNVLPAICDASPGEVHEQAVAAEADQVADEH